MSETVAAIIPNWNRVDLLAAALRNLRAQSHPPDHVLVVDNGSTDNSAHFARQQGAEVIAFRENRGFAAAVNEGITRSQTDYVLILNNDVVLQPDWLARVLDAAVFERAPFVVGKLLRPGGKQIDGSFDLISRGAYAWRSGYAKPDGPTWSRRRYIHLAPMTAALFHRSVFQRVGLLETRFESYYEDVEFGLRCALAGIHGLYEPAATAIHMSKTTLGRSSRRVYFNSARNQVHILARYFSRDTLLRFAWPILVGQTLSLLAAARQGNFFAALTGKWAGLRQWKSFRRRYSPEQQRRIESIFETSEREIFELQEQTGFDLYWKIYFALVRPKRFSPGAPPVLRTIGAMSEAIGHHTSD